MKEQGAQSVGNHAELIDIKALMEEWEETAEEREFVPGLRVTGKVYRAVPEPVPLLLRALVTAAIQAESLEDAKIWLSKMMDLLSWIQAIGQSRPTTAEHISEGIVLVPHAGTKTHAA